ncbi:hypothetical protein CC86DRAFT_410994 [Ophiobolus disseminans]|uniref:RING-type domain-containing protein n=1 Tax=Ophiobolus disseminans TaxID=1469910 RepID=A0A6A6ZLT6_9PLEO|nr:hypothetical protein CC86DRAFT_410994 [Ophiobolus disseminans]
MADEMRYHDCQKPVPDFTPHPAYNEFREMLGRFPAADITIDDILKENPEMEKDTPVHGNLMTCIYWYMVNIGVIDNQESGNSCPCGFRNISDSSTGSDSDGESSEREDDESDADDESDEDDDSTDEDTDDEESESFKCEMDEEEADDFVSALDTVALTSILPEDMRCPICWDDFDEKADRGIDNTPVRTPCCKKLFMKGCRTEALVGDDVRCPMCRQDIVGDTEY